MNELRRLITGRPVVDINRIQRAPDHADDFPGHLEHDCDPAKHPALTARQGLSIGRSPRPEAASRIPLDQLLACIHRGAELRRESCPACPAGTRIKIFACAIHGECQLDEKIQAVMYCGKCSDQTGSMAELP